MTKEAQKHNNENSSLIIKNGKFWLKLARANAKWPWGYIIVAIVLTAIVLLCVGTYHCCHGESNPIGKAFADMVSPVTLRNVAYESNTIAVVDTCSFDNKVTSIKAEDRSLLGVSLLFLFGTLVFSGLVIASLTNTMRNWAERFKQGKLRVGRFSGHSVIIGYNDMVLGIIKKYFSDKEKEQDGEKAKKRNLPMLLVGVKSDVQGTWYRIRDHAYLSRYQLDSIVIFQVDSNNDDHLTKRLQVQRASEVYIIGEDDDADNLKVYKKVLEICKTRKPECYVHLQYQSTIALFQTYTEGIDHFHAFNIHDVLARQLFSNNKNSVLIKANSDKYVHFVIVGMTEMGEAIAREAAFLCHYPNFDSRGIRTRITFIDPKASEHMTYFTGRYHHLFDLCSHTFRHAGGVLAWPVLEKNFLDIEFEFVEANIADATMQREISEWAEDKKQLLTMAICANHPHRNMAAGLYLPDAVFENKIPVWVYQPAKSDMKEYLRHSHFDNIVTFGIYGEEFDIKNTRIISQAKRLNHFYWHCNDEKVVYEKDTVDDEWDKIRIFDKWSNVYNVSAIPVKLDSIGGSEHLNENIEVLAQVEHNRWNVEKLLMGFRPTTEEEHQKILNGEKTKKEYQNEFIHDNIRPFKELDMPTQDIDRNFTREIPKIKDANK